MDEGDLIELAFHRALRGEVPPSVRGVTLDLRGPCPELHVFADSFDLDRNLFERTILCELDRVFPDGRKPPTRVRFTYEPSAHFQRCLGQRTLICNAWAESG